MVKFNQVEVNPIYGYYLEIASMIPIWLFNQYGCRTILELTILSNDSGYTIFSFELSITM